MEIDAFLPPFLGSMTLVGFLENSAYDLFFTLHRDEGYQILSNVLAFELGLRKKRLAIMRTMILFIHCNAPVHYLKVTLCANGPQRKGRETHFRIRSSIFWQHRLLTSGISCLLTHAVDVVLLLIRTQISTANVSTLIWLCNS